MDLRKIGLLVISTVLVLSLALTGCAQKAGVKTTGTAPDGNETSIEASAFKLISAQKAGNYELVDTKTLKDWVDQGKDMIVIDTMPADFYAKGHVPKAVNAELPKTSLADATAEQKAAFAKLLGDDKSKTIVVYCGFVGCERSHAGAMYAKELGYTNVYRFPGGIISWQDSKFDVEK